MALRLQTTFSNNNNYILGTREERAAVKRATSRTINSDIYDDNNQKVLNDLNDSISVNGHVIFVIFLFIQTSISTIINYNRK